MASDSAVQACLNELRKRITGELRTDAYSRNLYSTDASIYQVHPHAVLIPADREDVHAAVEAAVEFDVPLLPRTAGSSLAGQTVNEALVIDFTRHLDAVLEVNPEAQTVRVEPGVVLGALNARLLSTGLQFGPDPASANRAAIGGIVSNNATGAHSILYGMTADHVVGMNVILSDGSRAELGCLDDDELARRSSFQTLEGSLYRRVQDLIANEANREIIRTRTPAHWRRCGGYNLDRFVDRGIQFRWPRPSGFNLASLISGAEGTLAVIEDVTLNLVPRPKSTALAIIHFNDLHTALSAVPVILETSPTAVELLDHLGMSLCRNVPAWKRKLEGFVDGDPNCVLVTEYYGESESELKSQIERLKGHLVSARCGAGETVSVLDADRQADVWNVRKMGLGFLMSIKGDHKPIPFIEDAAVPTEHLAEYVIGIERFCKDLGTEVAYYAHASAGCVHIRPLINTKSAMEISRLPEITSFAIELLHGFGGALSSEHGDGRARSAFNESFFGQDLYGLYREVKSIFDPSCLLNPGNIVDAGPMTENLRFGPDYRVPRLVTHLDFSADMGFDRAVEMCNGAGVCRKLSDGTMCPSFMATRDEEHSTRGRANALRAVISGQYGSNGLGNRRLYETMDLCLECKACTSECPSSVDMTRLKTEFLAQYYERNRTPLRARLFGAIARQSRLLSGRAAPVVNAMMRIGLFRWWMDRMFRITRHRPMPPFAREPFTDWFSSHEAPTPGGEKVVLFNDTFNTYNYPQTAIAATRVLEAAGFEVLLPGHHCCGRPMLSKGLVKEARKAALETIGKLAPFAEQGIPIIGLEPSCLLTFRDEYAALLPDDPRVALVASTAVTFEEFISDLAASGRLNLSFTEAPAEILLHGHCHQKAMTGTDASLSTLSLPPNYSVKEINSGCCGLAGSFGFETEHYDISMKIGEDRLLPAVREAGAETIIAASGVSCRQQIEHGSGRGSLHPAEILWAALKTSEQE